jgi:uncharacterized protein
VSAIPGTGSRNVAKTMLRTEGDAVILAVRVKPRSARAAVQGERNGRLLVQVTAPPQDGRANEAVCRLLAANLRVAAGRVRIVSGQRGRDKLVRIDGLAAQDVAARLTAAGADAA